MKRFGTVSYNIYCNFTNYGSALQTWALHQAVNALGRGRWQAVLVDYCPDVLADKNPLDPFKNMWDQDAESQRMCMLSMPAIHENYYKFDRFYHEHFLKTERKYTSSNFNEISADEHLDGFICGSDTIFCPDEFGVDDGYFAEYLPMKRHSVAYAASFGEPHFTQSMYSVLNGRLLNFRAFGLRENAMVSYVADHTRVPVKKVLDPTLLLEAAEYDSITEKRLEREPYLLLYGRRYNVAMETYADDVATRNGWRIVEISLRASNEEKGHKMFYEAGIEEFLSLVKYAEMVVTNSYHGMIFSIQFQKEFAVFSREQCDVKIMELLESLGLSDRRMISGHEIMAPLDYNDIHERIMNARRESLEFLNYELGLLAEDEGE